MSRTIEFTVQVPHPKDLMTSKVDLDYHFDTDAHQEFADAIARYRAGGYEVKVEETLRPPRGYLVARAEKVIYENENPEGKDLRLEVTMYGPDYTIPDHDRPEPEAVLRQVVNEAAEAEREREREQRERAMAAREEGLHAVEDPESAHGERTDPTEAA